MKRNIISSKVEPQNTEDLWLNLVDGNIYSYEYGTWTNVNNVPNRVFNLDIDYTEENLTKFLSPLYEEGFSDDDFPKKVWDKYCETNPEFKLQGERENIRINCDLCNKGKIIDNFENSGYHKVPFSGIMKVVDGVDEIAWPTTSSMSGRLFIYDLDLKITKGIYDYSTKISRISDDEVLWDSVNYYDTPHNICIPIHILNQYNILNKKHDFMYSHYSAFDRDLSKDDAGVYFIVGNPFTVKIASADIKLKQAHASSNMVLDDNWNISNIGYGIEYILGLVSNKLDSKKMWEYLGEDTQYLIPARIDVVLPYDMSLYDTFTNTVNSADFYSLFLPDLEIFLYCGLSKHLPYGQWSDLNAYNIYGNLCSPIKLGLYKNRVNKKGTPIDVLCTSNPTELKDVYVDMNVKYSEYPEYWNDPSSATKAYNEPMYFIDSYLSFNNNCSLHAYPGSINNSYTAIIDDLKIGIRLSMSEEIYIFKYTADMGIDSDPFEEDIFWKMNTSIENWKKAIEYLKREYDVNEETKYKKIIINTAGMTVGEGPIIPMPELKPLEYIQFVGSEYDYANPNEVTFNDVGIAIMHQTSRAGTKLCHILDKKTGIEYSLTDLGYNENFIWISKDNISDSSNHHITSSYMLASDFKNILDRFNILNRKHSSVEVKLDDGNTMEQYLGTNYVFNVIDAKDKDKNDIVKLASQEISFMRVWRREPETNIIYSGIVEWAYPGEVTPEFFEELEKEGWEVNYE